MDLRHHLLRSEGWEGRSLAGWGRDRCRLRELKGIVRQILLPRFLFQWRCRERRGDHLRGCREALGREIRRTGCIDDVADPAYLSRSGMICQ
jgi:hypothetical protein